MTADPSAAASPPAASAPKANGNGRGRIIFIIILIVAAILGGVYYLLSRGYESTDDAFVEGNIILVSPQVAGLVSKLHFDDNQHVNSGDLLVEIDDRDYQAQAQQAQATLAAAQARLAAAETELTLTRKTAPATLEELRGALAGVQGNLAVARAAAGAAENNVAAAQARVTRLQAEHDRAQADLQRYDTLLAQGAATSWDRDRFATAAAVSAAALLEAQAAAGGAQANLQAARAQIAAAEGKVSEIQAKLAAADTVESKIALAQAARNRIEAEVAQAQAGLAQAQLNLSYTKITAARPGFITRKAVNPGNYIRPSQALFALVTDDRWITANFKETQLNHMKPGQAVSIKIDAFPGQKFTGKIDSIQHGTGARFSLLPAENATGNYVKVVQRVPVKITFDPLPKDLTLPLGLSVVPRVKISE